MSLLDKNKETAIQFYKTAFEGNPRQAVKQYVGSEYRQHNPLVEDGTTGFIAYFENMATKYPDKSVNFVRSIAEGDLVALHTHQIWGEPDNKEYVTMDFFRFDDKGKIIEHWDSIQEVVTDTKSGRTMY
ncbi:nuclear transport factor 2 family protein [Streptococcus troglodytae]|uniref:SnoaL-like polyketide cyclase family protein n=1 Tax=Streptococcus troglodytae TaxID=1111760 RepID=A0A1L7LKS0_9STRE|nr:ester cyclase [Streptococcus troglodytae]BAQ24718.1 snoaL-like polyketide cyclase family protein [Streptococcus troglodytae]